MNEEQLIVEQIHKSFDEAQDVLLKEAKSTIKANIVKDTEYVKKMHKLGFVNSKPVVEAKRKLEAAMASNEKAELILYYKDTYPLLKFLTVEKLDEICKKYNLIYAPVDRYLEAVPMKNAEDIFASQELKKKDKMEEQYKVVITDWKKWNKKATKEDTEFIEKWRDGLTHSGLSMTSKLPSGKMDWPTFKACTEFEKENMDGLFIAAPESHFNLEGLTKKGERSFFQKERIKVNDPIVFRYVKGGIQVLTKWGLEANDPELANPLDN